jgi:hypothetical protein
MKAVHAAAREKREEHCPQKKRGELQAPTAPYTFCFFESGARTLHRSLKRERCIFLFQEVLAEKKKKKTVQGKKKRTKKTFLTDTETEARIERSSAWNSCCCFRAIFRLSYFLSFSLSRDISAAQYLTTKGKKCHFRRPVPYNISAAEYLTTKKKVGKRAPVFFFFDFFSIFFSPCRARYVLRFVLKRTFEVYLLYYI